jgi:hypothetical protein
MKRLVVPAAVLAGLCLVAAPPAVAAKKHHKLVVDVELDESRTTFVDLNENGQPDAGDSFLGTIDVYRKGTRRRIGTVSFTNLITSTEGDGRALFSAALSLNGGDIFVEGVTTMADAPVVYDAIVGGTRKYRGARGQARERTIGEGPDTSNPTVVIRVKLVFTTERPKKARRT